MIKSDDGAVVPLLATNEVLLRGLNALPGTSERIQAGAALEELFANYLANHGDDDAPSEPDSGDDQEIQLEYQRALKSRAVGQQLARKIVAQTVAYLKTPSAALTTSGGVCKDADKIRVYRGIGRQPLIGPNATTPTGGLAGVMVSSRWLKALLAEMKALRAQSVVQWQDQAATFNDSDQSVEVTGDDVGKVIYEHLSQLAQKPIAPEVFGFNDWFAITSEHSNDSSNSPLISTSMADYDASGFGPANLAIDICPERIAMGMYGDFGNFLDTYIGKEQEIYVPFFLLPEEITLVADKDCGTYVGLAQSTASAADSSDIRDQKDAAAAAERERRVKQCRPMPFQDQSPVNEVTRMLQQCYVNLRNGLESAGGKNVAFQYKPARNKFYRAVLDSSDSAMLRQQLATLAPLCQVDCVGAQALINTMSHVGQGSLGYDAKAAFLVSYTEDFKSTCSNLPDACAATLSALQRAGGDLIKEHPEIAFTTNAVPGTQPSRGLSYPCCSLKDEENEVTDPLTIGPCQAARALLRYWKVYTSACSA